MTIFSHALRAAACACALLMAVNPAWSQAIKIGGTGSSIELLRRLAPAFKADSGITLDVIPGLGSSGANRALMDGKLGLSVAGRDVRDKEVAKGLKVVTTFRTPYGLASSRPNPGDIKSAGVTAFYGADEPVWQDGSPVVIILRPVDESDNILIARLFPGMADVLMRLRKRRDITIAATDQDNADLAERAKGSVIMTSLAQTITETRKLHFFSIDGVAPSLEALEKGTYPYAKIFYVTAPQTISPEATAFLAFLAKPAAQAILRGAAVIAGK